MFRIFKKSKSVIKNYEPEILVVEKDTYVLTCVEKMSGCIKITIQKKGSCICSKNFLIQLGAFSDEYFSKILTDAAERERIYESYNGNTKFSIGKSLLNGTYSLITT